jgi:hypothetical protein
LAALAFEQEERVEEDARDQVVYSGGRLVEHDRGQLQQDFVDLSFSSRLGVQVRVADRYCYEGHELGKYLFVSIKLKLN